MEEVSERNRRIFNEMQEVVKVNQVDAFEGMSLFSVFMIKAAHSLKMTEKDFLQSMNNLWEIYKEENQ